MAPEVLPIHFDNLQGKHEINTDSLLVFIDSYKEIADFFGFAVDIQIGLPEEGGWKTNLFLGISFIGASPFITLLTGETADDSAKKGNTEIVKIVNEFITKKSSEYSRRVSQGMHQAKEQDLSAVSERRLHRQLSLGR